MFSKEKVKHLGLTMKSRLCIFQIYGKEGCSHITCSDCASINADIHFSGINSEKDFGCGANENDDCKVLQKKMGVHFPDCEDCREAIRKYIAIDFKDKFNELLENKEE